MAQQKDWDPYASVWKNGMTHQEYLDAQNEHEQRRPRLLAERDERPWSRFEIAMGHRATEDTNKRDSTNRTVVYEPVTY